MKWQKDAFEIDTNIERLNVSLIHQFLCEESRWAKGIPLQTVEKSLSRSVNFGIYSQNRQIGFARVISDCATFANLVDVFVLPDYRHQGIATWLLNCIVEHPDLQGLRRWTLAATPEGQNLYRKIGFAELSKPEIFMERFFPLIYQ
ncbi:GNAT family N-acetyltransferase [Enterovibrio sp. ZSDZ42]|uniref:GNAT family N-acetyltransferase n=1 Tax=Enterovibrio gelatinilyticus TaxID=2899819 RepID=A0ABT5QUP9_9GAMM|nr:GNAT family N-acetyltransferase [Enterovibrio sp. ZSDZ42]MDD1791718.1 GNAT family N-acetyltransferase [Enterovibrio sp. ZSDZ42]